MVPFFLRPFKQLSKIANLRIIRKKLFPTGKLRCRAIKHTFLDHRFKKAFLAEYICILIMKQSRQRLGQRCRKNPGRFLR